jgi:hypothetical protein
MNLALATTASDLAEDSWFTFAEDDLAPVRFKIRPWTRTTQSEIDERAKKRVALKKLEQFRAEGVEIPKGTGDRKTEAQTVETADYLIEDWENVTDSKDRPLECNIVNKLWAFESIDLAMWILARAKERGGRLVEAQAKNS